MNRIRLLISNPRRLFFVGAIIPVLAFNLPANAWLLGLMLPTDALWLAWGTAVAFEASIVALQTWLPNGVPGSSERRAAWAGLIIVVGLSVIANVGHDVQYFTPINSKLAAWLDSVAAGMAWLLPIITGTVRPAILIVFSIVVARPFIATITKPQPVARLQLATIGDDTELQPPPRKRAKKVATVTQPVATSRRELSQSPSAIKARAWRAQLAQKKGGKVNG